MTYVKALQNNAFRTLYIGIILSNLAASIANISLIWIAYNKFNSPLVIAIVLGALELPALVIGPFLGGFLDKFKKSNLMIFAYLTNASVFLFLMLNPLKSMFDFTIFIGLLVISGAVKPLLMGGNSMFIQDIFPVSEERVVANALTTMSFDMTYIFGSLLSGMVMALGYGLKVYMLVAVLYIVVALCIWRVSKLIMVSRDHVNEKADEYKGYFDNLKQAFHTILSNHTLLYVLLMDFLWNMLLWAGLTVLMPILVKQHFMAGASQYGLLESMTSIGIVLGSIVVGKVQPNPKWLVSIVVGAIGLHGVLFSVIGVSNNVPTTAILLMIIGLIVAPALIYKNTFYQQTFDSDARGALFTVAGTMTTASYPIGIALASGLATLMHSNPSPIFIGYGLMVVIISIVVYWRLNRTV